MNGNYILSREKGRKIIIFVNYVAKCQFIAIFNKVCLPAPKSLCSRLVMIVTFFKLHTTHHIFVGINLFAERLIRWSCFSLHFPLLCFPYFQAKFHDGADVAVRFSGECGCCSCCRLCYSILKTIRRDRLRSF